MFFEKTLEAIGLRAIQALSGHFYFLQGSFIFM
jgi:hypothetical protein